MAPSKHGSKQSKGKGLVIELGEEEHLKVVSEPDEGGTFSSPKSDELLHIRMVQDRLLATQDQLLATVSKLSSNFELLLQSRTVEGENREIRSNREGIGTNPRGVPVVEEEQRQQFQRRSQDPGTSWSAGERRQHDDPLHQDELRTFGERRDREDKGPGVHRQVQHKESLLNWGDRPESSFRGRREAARRFAQEDDDISFRHSKGYRADFRPPRGYDDEGFDFGYGEGSRKSVPNSKSVGSIPRSDVNREYFAEEHDRRARAGIDYESSYGKAQPNDTILKLQRTTQYYKRNRAHVCSFYVRGECTRGAECPYRHEMPDTGELSQQNIKDRHYGVNDPVAMKLLNMAGEMPSLVPPEDENIRTLYVDGIDARITEQDLRDHFYAQGEIETVRLVPQLACAFVTYTTREGAEKAAEELSNKLVVKGLRLKLLWGKPQASKPESVNQGDETARAIAHGGMLPRSVISQQHHLQQPQQFQQQRQFQQQQLQQQNLGQQQQQLSQVSKGMAMSQLSQNSDDFPPNEQRIYVATPQKKEYFLCAETPAVARAWVSTLQAAQLVLKAHKEAVNSSSGTGPAQQGSLQTVVAAANSAAMDGFKEIDAAMRISMRAALSAITSKKKGFKLDKFDFNFNGPGFGRNVSDVESMENGAMLDVVAAHVDPNEDDSEEDASDEDMMDGGNDSDSEEDDAGDNDEDSNEGSSDENNEVDEEDNGDDEESNHSQSESLKDEQVRVLWLDLSETVNTSDEISVVDRSFLQGDIVASAAAPTGQLGIVEAIHVTVDLLSVDGPIMKGISIKHIGQVCDFAVGDYVTLGPWLGRVEDVLDNVTVLFDDGSICKVLKADPSQLRPLSGSEHADIPYYPGQRVKATSSSILKNSRWLAGSWKASRLECTVMKVQAGALFSHWIASANAGNGADSVTSPNEEQKPKNVTRLSSFRQTNWQLGDWCHPPADDEKR